MVSVPRRDIYVLKGRNVETGTNFFVEGVWDGDFPDGGFDKTDVFFGSGMKARESEVVFCSSCATVDALHYRQQGDTFLVSNSLPLLLAGCGDRLDPNRRDYVAINRSITKGINDFERSIPTRVRSVQRAIYYNLVLTTDGISEAEKPMPPGFRDFNSYRDYIRRGLLHLIDNASSPRRRSPLKILSSQSRGYDSTAINSLLPTEKVDTVFTIPASRKSGRVSYRDTEHRYDDSGEEICRHLGLRYAFIDGFGVEDKPELEALCFMSVHNGTDANLAEVFERNDRPAIFVTGVLGEIWSTSNVRYGQQPFTDSNLKRGDLSLHGLTELRLEHNIVHVAVPFIGARRRKDIIGITESEEMASWHLGGAYDRPIPRRIAEEAGVPRGMFGQKKMATSTLYGQPFMPRNPELRCEFFEFLSKNRLASATTLRLMPIWLRFNEIVKFHWPRRNRVIDYLDRMQRKVTGRRFWPPYLLDRLNASLFCYCVNARADTYASLIERSGFLNILEGDASDSTKVTQK